MKENAIGWEVDWLMKKLWSSRGAEGGQYWLNKLTHNINVTEGSDFFEECHVLL